MTAPRICRQCGRSSVQAKGLCSSCYQAQWYREYPDARKYSRHIDRTTYLEDFTARNRAWHERRLEEELARKLAARRTSEPPP
jgi:ribosomal protein L37E